MPVFFQQQINEDTRIGVWKIEETEDFFKRNVPQHRAVTHPHKRLQHLAGRFLLQFMFPDFPYELIQIADTRKPYLPGEQYHFSISHCGDYAAAIVSRTGRVGIDIEIPVQKIAAIRDKFLSNDEKQVFQVKDGDFDTMTLLWSCKEAVFKWYGDGRVDFKGNILLKEYNDERNSINCSFTKTNEELNIRFHRFEQLVLSWVV